MRGCQSAHARVFCALFRLGVLPGTAHGRGPGHGPLVGLRGHHLEDIVCKTCLPVLPPGSDRDLVLKVVRRHQDEIRFCYESELVKVPSPAGSAEA